MGVLAGAARLPALAPELIKITGISRRVHAGRADFDRNQIPEMADSEAVWHISIYPFRVACSTVNAGMTAPVLNPRSGGPREISQTRRRTFASCEVSAPAKSGIKTGQVMVAE
jgi:hypothetical protein